MAVLADSQYPSQNIDALTYPSCDDHTAAAAAATAASPEGASASSVSVSASASATTAGRAQRLWLLARGGAASARELQRMGLLKESKEEGRKEQQETEKNHPVESRAASASSSSDAVLAYDPCVDNYALDYLNRADVQAALHVNASSSKKATTTTTTTTTTVRWSECSFSLDYSGRDGMVPMMPIYEALVADPTPLKLEVYSGDDDSNCPTLGSMEWLYGLGLQEEASWAPWYARLLLPPLKSVP